MNNLENSAIAQQLAHVRIVMVNTTLPANIGSALRAMKTMGLSQLTLVAPKTYPHPDIDALAAGAQDLIEQIHIVECLEDAIKDCHIVFGTSARSRTIPWPLLDVRPAAQLSMQAVKQKQQNIAIVFGREDRGLTNEELALANYHLTIPVNQEYGVLNVAQAIQIICYELRMASVEQVQAKEVVSHNITKQTTDLQDKNYLPLNTLAADQAPMQMSVTSSIQMDWDEPLVNHEQMQAFYPHLEKMLVDIEFLDPDNPRLLPLRLRRLFGRIQLDKMEYHLLRGVFSRVQALSQGTWKKNQINKEEK